MKNRTISILILLIFSILIIGCKGDVNTEEPEEKVNNTIQITSEQFIQENMQVGTAELKFFDDELKVSGKIVSPVNGITHVSSKISGIIEHIYVNSGDYVNKNQVLLTVSSNELIVLQQSFAETSILVNKLKSDYDRIKRLYQEQISSEKEFIAIESEYNSSKVRYNSLKMQVQRLGLDIDKIETGEFYTNIPVYAPISGYVTEIDIVLGQYVELQSQLIELINIRKLQIELSVYEKDMKSIEKGNKLTFTSFGNAGKEMSATIISVGKSVDFETNTVTCIAKPDSVETLINNSYVEVYLKSEKREVLALPSDALVKSDGKYYVFVVENKSDGVYKLKQTLVETGITYKGYTEIINGDDLEQVIVHGAYNLPVE